MYYRLFAILITLFAVLTGTRAFCQNSSNNCDTSLEYAKEYFKNNVAAGSFLYSGREYAPYSLNIKGNPFFDSGDMNIGNVFYDGHLYENVPMLYDIVRQLIIIDRYHDNPRITLLSEKVKYFTIHDHLFQNIHAENGSYFYDITYNGVAGVWVKRIKVTRKAVHAEEPDSFTERDEFYIKKGNSLFAVTNKASALAGFEDKQNQLKSFIRKKKLTFKKNIEQDLIQVASFYSSLQ